ncbi:rhodanese-like domain-containing protein [Salegentibacter chungangensis]|uniref:Rhodanese-like domain-containing protein n=1 Tax=Salegentibacter chungangensis TaxID=1335724 RepID=A0ABW3NRZ5_9FLAO
MSQFRLFFALGLLSLIGLQSCKKAKAVEANAQLISVQEMKTQLKMDDVQLVDLRLKKDFASSHILSAENIVYDENFKENINALDKDKPVIVYCYRGVTSKRAVEILQKSGFKKIYELEGGIAKWVQEENKAD